MSVLNASIYLDKLLWFVKSEIVDINGNLCINYFSGLRPLEFGQIYASSNIGLTIVTEKYIARCWKNEEKIDLEWIRWGLCFWPVVVPISKQGSKSWTLF